MRCQELMKKDVKCMHPQDTVQAAALRMRNDKIGFLPICDQAKKVVGTITDRDLAIRVLADGRQATVHLEDVMTREVVACRPEDELQKAEELMSRHHKSRMMVIDAGGRLVGVISLSDIAVREPGNQASQTLRQISEREVRA